VKDFSYNLRVLIFVYKAYKSKHNWGCKKMGNSVLVFVSHSSDDKQDYVEPIVRDLEDCYINIWLDKQKIVPGDNLRKSIFRDGLDKADIVLIFFTEQSLQSSWVDKEIKHVLREESKKGNNFDLNKIISIFDSQKTYDEISERYPDLTDNLLHLMPKDYSKKELGQLVSAIWSKYLDLQGGDVETQKQLLAKDKEIFQKEKAIEELKQKLSVSASNVSASEFEEILNSGKLDELIANKEPLLLQSYGITNTVSGLMEARAFGLIKPSPIRLDYFILTEKGIEFFKWLLFHKAKP
jgi:hypothetical protein